MISRRSLLQKSAELGGAAAMMPAAIDAWAASPPAVEVNDVQSQLNRTTVRRIVRPHTIDAICAAIDGARREGCAVSVAGGRHSMGGQQLGTDTVHLDATACNQVVHFDAVRGRIEVDGGILWPDLIDFLQGAQAGAQRQWTIRQKQTGVDRVTVAGSLSSNIHGRGLRFPPIISDVESFVLVDASGTPRTCSRRENPELFALAIGGYGLFGVIARVTLRLVPRTKIERVVRVIPVGEFVPAVDRRIEEGFVLGDCQYATHLEGDAADHPGVFACYRPVPAATPVAEKPVRLSQADWTELYRLARTDKKKAFAVYSNHYLSTSGQVYWSDIAQLSGNFAFYHEGLKQIPAEQRGTEMITEVYVKRERLVPFLRTVRADFIRHQVDPTYGTIRLIEKDDESFLAWARDRLVCIVCNLHVVHTQAGIAKAQEDFRRIIDRAIEHGGHFYLTYHRWATRLQVETCYPQFVDFLKLKRKYDPRGLFQSDWYAHSVRLFADRLGR